MILTSKHEIPWTDEEPQTNAKNAYVCATRFWRDRTREVDFVVDRGGKLELFEAKWTELPDPSDAVNLEYVSKVVGKARVASGAVVCRTPNSFPLSKGFRALPVSELT